MSMIRCAKTAAAVGKMAEQERKQLEKMWSREYNSAMAAGAHSAAATQAANAVVWPAIKAKAAHMKRNALLTISAQKKLITDMSRFRNRKGEADVGEWGAELMRTLESTAEAAFKLDVAEMGAMVAAFRKSMLSGARQNGIQMMNVVREAFGEDTGDAVAKTFADEVWTPLNRKKLAQFNEAGGDVATREDWGMPTHHDTLSVITAGAEKWKAAMRLHADFTKMQDPMTGKPLTAAQFEEALDEVFLKMAANGSDPAGHLAGEQGAAMWRRRSDPRFFAWKSADDWIAYHNQFGAGVTPFEVMTGWLRSMNHDLTAMQTLGPNPGATVSWIGRVVLSEQAKHVRGEPSLHPTLPANSVERKPMTPRQSSEYAVEKQGAIEGRWQIYTGEANRPVNKQLAYVEATASNLIYAAMLPFTVGYTGADLVNQALTRAYVGLSKAGMFEDFITSMRLSKDKREIAELGLEIDTGLSAMGSDARETAFIHGAGWSRWIADRAMTLGHLKPITQGLRAMWTLGNLHQLARQSKTAWADLDATYRGTLERYDIDEGAWEYIQATPLTHTSAGTQVLRLADIANTDIFTPGTNAAPLQGPAYGERVSPRPGLNRGQEIALRLQRMIVEEGEYATISGTIKSRRVGRVGVRPGTGPGLLAGSWAKLKTYPISHFQHHGYRAANIFHANGGGIRGTAQASAYYLAGCLFPSVIMVAMGAIAVDMAAGKDPPDVTDPDFWNRMTFKALSLGWATDLAQGLLTPDDGFDKFDTGGPIIGLAADTAALGKEAIRGVMGEEKAKPGRAAVRLGRRLTPSTYYSKLATDRLIWDNIQKIVDPEAEASFDGAQGRLQSQRGQEYWWAPGEATPERAPDLGALDVAPFNADGDGPINAAPN